MKIYENIKKLNILMVFVCMIFLCACTAEPTVENDTAMSIVTVNFPQYDIARAVCGNDENIKMIIRPGAEVHGYEPSLADILAIENADVFIYNGGESDVWVERVLSGVDTSDTLVIRLMETEGLSLYREEHSHHTHTEEHDHNHSGTHEGKNYDEHIWTSPKNYVSMVKRVADEMSSLMPQRSADFLKNANEYVEDLEALDAELKHVSQKSEHSFIAVADKFPFLYMAKDYGIEYIAGFTGCSAESDAGARVLVNMVDEIKHHGVKCVFHVELSNQKMANAVAKHTGAEKLLLHSCQNVTKAEFESGKTYVSIMNENIKNLKEALW